MLPTNAKITALVCSGRSRPKLRYGPRFACQKASCSATSAPTSMPMKPQNTDAAMNLRVTSSSYVMRCVSTSVPLLLPSDGRSLVLERQQRQSIGVVVAAVTQVPGEEDQLAGDECQAHEHGQYQ